LAAGQPIDHVASVASFFVSRVDTAVDAQLEQRIGAGETELNELLGKAAIANAKLAYESFKKTFAGSRWQALAAKGAMLQRPLWGSTSTKSPRYPDVMYVDELIGPHTVNTMPPATIDAFRDHGKLGLTLAGRSGRPAADPGRARLARSARSYAGRGCPARVAGRRGPPGGFRRRLPARHGRQQSLPGGTGANVRAGARVPAPDGARYH